MEKLKLYIEKWIDGKQVKGINVSLYDMLECIDIYNSILENRNDIEFINENVKRVLDKCDIKTFKYGIGWKVA